jgi:very-short-patch-repair endonuclease
LFTRRELEGGVKITPTLARPRNGGGKRYGSIWQVTGELNIMKTNEDKKTPWITTPELWEKLKPVAREMRKELTQAEKMLWQRLRRNQMADLPFRRQFPIERFIVDFYCPVDKLAIELDGSIHQYNQMEDRIRMDYIESLGIKMIRFSNEEIFTKISSVLATILAEINMINA